MKVVIVNFLVILLIFGFINCDSNRVCNKNTVTPIIPEIKDTIQYKKDRNQIEECYIANVEYYRINPGKLENNVIFEPYGVYYASDSLGYLKLPSPSDKNVQVQAREIIYSLDKLIVLVFLGVKQTIKQDSIEKRDEGREYDARLLIGLRNRIDEGFVLYPSRIGSQVGYPNYEIPIENLKYKLFNCLAKSKNFWGKEFRTNVGDKNFWKNNLLFDKVKLSDTGEEVYFFQTYQLSSLGDKRYRGNHFLYDVVNCSGEIKVDTNSRTNFINFLTKPYIRKDLDENGNVPK